MKILTQITGIISENQTPLTKGIIPRQRQPGDMYRVFHNEGVVLVDSSGNDILIPWIELEKIARAEFAPNPLP